MQYIFQNLMVLHNQQDIQDTHPSKFDLYNHYTYRPDTNYIPKVQNLLNTDQTDTAYNLVRMYPRDNKRNHTYQKDTSTILKNQMPDLSQTYHHLDMTSILSWSCPYRYI